MQRIRRCGVLGAVVAVALLAGCSGVSDVSSEANDEPVSVTDSLEDFTNTTPIPVNTVSGPSQLPEEAARDGVLAEMAALPLNERSEARLSVAGVDGTWVLSTVPMGNAVQILGDPDGVYGVDYVATSDYGEILFLDESGSVALAIPLPGSKPTWIHVTNDTVYAGRVGDGGQPHTLFVRFQRATGGAEVVLVAAEASSATESATGYRFVARTEAALWSQAQQILSTVPGPALVEAPSWTGPTYVSLEALDAFMDEAA